MYEHENSTLFSHKTQTESLLEGTKTLQPTSSGYSTDECYRSILSGKGKFLRVCFWRLSVPNNDGRKEDKKEDTTSTSEKERKNQKKESMLAGKPK